MHFLIKTTSQTYELDCHAFFAFTIGEHSPKVSSPIVNTQKCPKLICVSLTFGAHWQKCGERCGEVYWDVGGGEERC